MDGFVTWWMRAGNTGGAFCACISGCAREKDIFGTVSVGSAGTSISGIPGNADREETSAGKDDDDDSCPARVPEPEDGC